MAAFAKGLNFVFKWEGGYVNDPKDPGGETKFGISKRSHPYLDIRNLDKEQAAKVYLEEYWNPLGCDEYDDRLAIAIFDAAVNCGVSRVKTWLDLDFRPPRELTLEEFNARREYYYRAEVKESLRNRYLKGWLNRLNDLRWYLQTKVQ